MRAMSHRPGSHRISLHLTGTSAAELVAAAKACEDAGVESIWASELYTNAYIPLAAVASATETVTLGTGVVLAFVRSPLAIGLAALDMDSLCSGRFVLGLGTGVRRLNESWHGVTNFGGPVRHMREVVAFLRTFTEKAHLGERMVFDGEFVKADIRGYKRPTAPARERIPIYLGANKPLMLRLAGEVADGVLGHLFLSPRHLKDEFLPRIAEGLERGGRQRSELTVSAGITCAIDEDRATARRHAAGPIAFYASVKTYQPILAADGFADECEQIRAAFQAGERDRGVDLVTDEMIDTYCAAGTPDEVLKKVAQYDGLLDVKGISPPRHFCPADAHAHYRTRILEVFGG